MPPFVPRKRALSRSASPRPETAPTTPPRKRAAKGGVASSSKAKDTSTAAVPSSSTKKGAGHAHEGQSLNATASPARGMVKELAGAARGGSGRLQRRAGEEAMAIATAKAKAKSAVFQALDAPAKGRSVEDNRAFLEGGSDDDESESKSESDSSEEEFEDVEIQNKDGKVENSDDESEWEDALGPDSGPGATPATGDTSTKAAPAPSGDIQIEFTRPDPGSILDAENLWADAREAAGKKGPTKVERRVRVLTHCMHVQYLLFHNLMRNTWIQDAEVKKILLSKLTDGCWTEINKWRSDVGLPRLARDGSIVDESMATEDASPRTKEKAKGKATARSKGKGKAKEKAESGRKNRDWSSTAALEASSTSARNNLPRLLQYLLSFWKKTFRPNAPSLHKIGYVPAATLEKHLKSYAMDKGDVDRFGERIESREQFRECARKMTGSRDVGQQLFTGLLRAIGIEARMVCSLQPAGFGWGKGEEGKVKEGSREKDLQGEAKKSSANLDIDADDDSGGGFIKETPKSHHTAQESEETTPQKPARGSRNTPINLDDDSTSSLSSDLDSDISILDLPSVKPKTPSGKPSLRTLPFPTYWTEAFSPITHRPHAASPLVPPMIASTPDAFQAFEPRGKEADKAKQVFAYVVAFSSDGTAKDVTVRYLKRRQWPGKTKGVRMPAEKVPVYNTRGKVKKYEEFDWFKSIMSAYARDSRLRTLADQLEDEGDLVPVKPTPKEKTGGDDTLQGLKNSAEFVLERHLRREEAIRPKAKPVRIFVSGKGDKAKEEPVYRRKDVVTCKTVESWHKEGRELIAGAQPLKHVPMRAVTLIRKREIEEAERETGEKKMQGLYSKDQTRWIIPPPIEDGKIPRNVFGNIDVYVPSMVPQGAVHIPIRGTAKICKKLGIDYAEACTGFEFGKQRAVPVLTGVVVAEENEEIVKDAWRAEQEIQKRKDETKRRAKALAMWKKFCIGIRIVNRVRAEYGETGEEEVDVRSLFVSKKKRGVGVDGADDHDRGSWEQGKDLERAEEDMAGGFFLPGHEEEEIVSGPSRSTRNDYQEQDNSDVEGGGFIIEGEDEVVSGQLPLAFPNGSAKAPMSLQSLHSKKAGSEKNEGEENDDDEEMPDASFHQDEDVDTTTKPHRGRKPRQSTGQPRRKSAVKATSEDDESSDIEASEDKLPSKGRPAAASARTRSKKSDSKGPTRELPTRRAANSTRVTRGTRSKYFEPSESDLSGEEEYRQKGEGEEEEQEEQDPSLEKSQKPRRRAAARKARGV